MRASQAPDPPNAEKRRSILDEHVRELGAASGVAAGAWLGVRSGALVWERSASGSPAWSKAIVWWEVTVLFHLITSASASLPLFFLKFSQIY